MQQIVDRENYNPHHQQGDEQTIVVQVSVFAELQPTSPYGDELMENFEVVPTYLFQPTPRMGMNKAKTRSGKLRYISTHTPAWG